MQCHIVKNTLSTLLFLQFCRLVIHDLCLFSRRTYRSFAPGNFFSLKNTLKFYQEDDLEMRRYLEMRIGKVFATFLKGVGLKPLETFLQNTPFSARKLENRVSYKMIVMQNIFQPAHNVWTTLHGRWNDVRTLKRRRNNVVLTSCANWVSIEEQTFEKFEKSDVFRTCRVVY